MKAEVCAVTTHMPCDVLHGLGKCDYAVIWQGETTNVLPKPCPIFPMSLYPDAEVSFTVPVPTSVTAPFDGRDDVARMTHERGVGPCVGGLYSDGHSGLPITSRQHVTC